MRALLNRLTNLEKQTLNEGAKPDFLDMDKDGNKKEPMKKAVTDKKKPESNKAKKESRGGIAEALMKEMGYDLYEFYDETSSNVGSGAKPGTVGTGSGGQLVDGSGRPVQQGASPPAAAPAKAAAPAAAPAAPAGGAAAPANSGLGNTEFDMDQQAANRQAATAAATPPPTLRFNRDGTPVGAAAPAAAPAAKPGVDTGMTDRNPYDDNALAQQRLDAHQAQQTKYSAQGTPAPAPTPAPASGKVPNEYEIAQSQGQDPRTPNAKPNAAPTAPLQLPPGAKPSAGEKAAGITVAGAKPAAPAPAVGATGQSLEKLGVTKQQRLDQAFVDQKLGAGKFKAGSAEANTALLKAMQAKESRLSEDPELTAMLRIAGLR